MIKRKLLVSFISIVLSILLFPFILGMEYSWFQSEFLEAYLNSLFWLGLFNLMVLLAGIPVTFVAGFITSKMSENKYIVLLNLFIHLTPGIIILAVSKPSTSLFFFIIPGVPLFVGSIFFAVDELLRRKKHKFNGLIGIFLIPLVACGAIVFPSNLNQAADKKQMEVINETPIPEVEVTYNGTIAHLVNLTDCWELEHSDCEDQKDPFLLPIDPTGLTEYKVQGTPELLVKLNETEAKYTLRAYYLVDGKIEKINGKGNKIKFPPNLQEQAIRIVVQQDNNRKLFFHIGFRTGIRE